MKQGWTTCHQLCYDWNKNCCNGEKIELYDHNRYTDNLGNVICNFDGSGNVIYERNKEDFE